MMGRLFQRSPRPVSLVEDVLIILKLNTAGCEAYETPDVKGKRGQEFVWLLKTVAQVLFALSRDTFCTSSVSILMDVYSHCTDMLEKP